MGTNSPNEMPPLESKLFKWPKFKVGNEGYMNKLCIDQVIWLNWPYIMLPLTIYYMSLNIQIFSTLKISLVSIFHHFVLLIYQIPDLIVKIIFMGLNFNFIIYWISIWIMKFWFFFPIFFFWRLKIVFLLKFHICMQVKY